MGSLAMTPAAMMSKPVLLEAFARGPPWPSSGQRDSACAASPRCTCGGDVLARAGGLAARPYVCSPELAVKCTIA
eukprot:6061059-Alexandrium_andersonii.AAC.1